MIGGWCRDDVAMGGYLAGKAGDGAGDLVRCQFCFLSPVVILILGWGSPGGRDGGALVQ